MLGAGIKDSVLRADTLLYIYTRAKALLYSSDLSILHNNTYLLYLLLPLPL
jgi:hypothetical protein